MNADVQGLNEYFKSRKRKNFYGWLVCKSGYRLSDRECRAYIRWCAKKGYGTLEDCPDFEDVRQEVMK